MMELIRCVWSFYPGKRNDEEGAKEKLFTYASHVPVTSFKVRLFIVYSAHYYDLHGPVDQGLQTTVIDAE